MNDPKYIEVSAKVRYWEDAEINGTSDDQGELVPFRKADIWCPVIELDSGLIVDWPKPMTASIHYKVCDAGEYFLLDEQKNRIAKWGGFYVPSDFLCHGDHGYGDYIIFNVNQDGLIEKYTKPEIEFGCACEDGDEHQKKWTRL